MTMPRRRFLPLLLALALATCATVAPGQPAAPLFRLETVGALCGPLAAQERILAEGDFEETWRGVVGQGEAGPRLYVGRDAYWLLMIVVPGVEQGCVVSSGDAMEWGRGARE